MSTDMTPEQRLLHLVTSATALAEGVREDAALAEKQAEAAAGAVSAALEALCQIDPEMRKMAADGRRGQLERILGDRAMTLGLLTKLAGQYHTLMGDYDDLQRRAAPKSPGLGKVAAADTRSAAPARGYERKLSESEQAFIEMMNG